MKTALFVFNDDPMCFIHVLLNALDLHAHDHQVQVVLEGAAVKLVPVVLAADHPLTHLFAQIREKGLLAGACRACAVKLGVAKEIENTDVPLIGDMSGHPSMRGYMTQGYQIITF